MSALSRNQLTDRVEDRLTELQAALDADNRMQVDRLVANITYNQLVTIDFMAYLRWRGILRGQFIGNLVKDVVNTLA